jgi:acyl carrier protein
MYPEQIRTLLAAHARLLVPVAQLGDSSDLYEAGLTSLSTVNLMLALEEHFDVEFTDRMLARKTFATIRSLSDAIAELRGETSTAPAAPGSTLAARGAA